MAEVRALAKSARLVTLTGAGGCGKTRLGLQMAAELLDGSGDGVWLAALLDALALRDNCEHLIGGCAKTAEEIVRRCPRVHLLATSREPLGIGGETIYRVPSLSLPSPGEEGPPAPGSFDAVALFAERARAQGRASPWTSPRGRAWACSSGAR